MSLRSVLEVHKMCTTVVFVVPVVYTQVIEEAEVAGHLPNYKGLWIFWEVMELVYEKLQMSCCKLLWIS